MSAPDKIRHAWDAETQPPSGEAPTTTVEVPAPDARYEREGLVGRGGMGEIWQFRDHRLDRSVAAKQLRPESNRRHRQRFLREARVQAALDHPGVVPVHDLVVAPDGGLYFTMRKVEGNPLSAVLAESPSRSFHRLLTAFQSVCLTVQFAHEHGVIHRDLKPGNVMLGSFGEVYVLDWGIAKLRDEARHAARTSGIVTASGTSMGTPEYSAPEQYSNSAAADERSDVFSLGAILFEILTGEPLRHGHELEVQTAIFRPRDVRRRLRDAPDVPPELAETCARALEQDPDRRWQSARDLHGAIEGYLEGERDRRRRRTEAEGSVTSAMHQLSLPSLGPERDRSRAAALRELARALALDPSRKDALAALREALDSKVPSSSLNAELAENRNAVAMSTARFNVVTYGIWLAFLGLAPALGLRSALALAFIAAPVASLIALNLWVLRIGRFPRSWALFSLGPAFLAVSSVASFAGSYLLVPSLAMGTAVVFLVTFRFDRAITLASLVLAPLSVVLPDFLQLVGVMPNSYTFLGHVMNVAPTLVDFGPATRGVLWGAAVLPVVLTTMVVWRVVSILDQRERELGARAFWARQVLPDDEE